MVTHGDDDHCGSLASLRGVVGGAGRACVARDALSCPCASCRGLCADACALVGGDALCGLEVGGRGALRRLRGSAVVWPRAFSDEGGNADSLCLLARADVDHDGFVDWTALFCGDAEAEQLGRAGGLACGRHGGRLQGGAPWLARRSRRRRGCRTFATHRARERGGEQPLRPPCARKRSSGSTVLAHACSAPTSRGMFHAN